jgi:hypothetical protein
MVKTYDNILKSKFAVIVHYLQGLIAVSELTFTDHLKSAEISMQSVLGVFLPLLLPY